MMGRARAFCGFLVFLLGGAMALAQTRPAAPATSATEAPKPPSDLKIVLMDGSIVTGKLSVSDFTVETKFGTLKVPVDQITSFAPGLESHPQFAKALEGYISDLSADAFPDREKAQAALLKLGPDIKSELERQVKTAEAEKQMRLQKIIEDFDTQMGEDDSAKTHQWVNDDVIVTQGFTVVGRISTPGFAVVSPYGTLQLKFEDIREGHRDIQSGPEEINKNVTVAGTAISQRAMTGAGIRLNRGDQVTVTASGSITLTPWGDQAATPDGNANLGMATIPNGMMIGTLYAKVGESGTPVKVGSKATFTASAPGTLEFGVASPNGNYGSYQFPGEYQLKVHVVKKP